MDEEREIEIYNSTYDVQTDELATLYFGDCFDKINAVDDKSVDLILISHFYTAHSVRFGQGKV